MYHFFVSQEQIFEHYIRITGSDVNHINHVLRMKPGDQLLISNGVDQDYLCEIAMIAPDYVDAKILSLHEEGSELPGRIYLFQGLPKGDKMELVIQKAVELGAYQVIPVATKRTVVKLDEKKEAVRIRRWNMIAESAAKQSGRVIIPEVKGVMTLKEAFGYAGTFDRNLIPYENARGMEAARAEIAGVKPGMSVGVFIGPEGGFDGEEIDMALKQGVKPITLGKRILRTETAGLAVLSLLMFQLEE